MIMVLTGLENIAILRLMWMIHLRDIAKGIESAVKAKRKNKIKTREKLKIKYFG